MVEFAGQTRVLVGWLGGKNFPNAWQAVTSAINAFGGCLVVLIAAQAVKRLKMVWSTRLNSRSYHLMGKLMGFQSMGCNIAVYSSIV